MTTNSHFCLIAALLGHPAHEALNYIPGRYVWVSDKKQLNGWVTYTIVFGQR